jgi:argininosuccinate lyase
MPKLWEGRTSKETDSAADDFDSSIRVDSRMYRQDIQGSMAHAAMLGARGIIANEDAALIISGLEGILKDRQRQPVNRYGCRGYPHVY